MTSVNLLGMFIEGFYSCSLYNQIMNFIGGKEKGYET